MHETEKEIEKAILCGIHTGFGGELNDTTEETVSELSLLAETAGQRLSAK